MTERAAATSGTWISLGIAAIPNVAAAIAVIYLMNLGRDAEDVNVGDAFVAFGVTVGVAVLAAAALAVGLPIALHMWRTHTPSRKILWCVLALQAVNATIVAAAGALVAPIFLDVWRHGNH